MNKIIEKDSALRILSIFFAILLWFYVITEQNPLVHKDLTVSIKLINLDSLAQYDMVMTEDPSSFYMSLRLKGNKDTLDKIDSRTITAIADLRGFRSKGDNIVPVEINGVPQGIDIVSKSGESIKVKLEPIIDAQLPISVNIMGNPSQGLAALNAVTNPTEVVIRGAESLVKSVKKVSADIDIANMNAEVKKKVPIKLLNAEGKNVINVEVNPQIVEVSIPIENVKAVPIELDLSGNLKAGYVLKGSSVFPAEIYIAGKKEIIDSISSIKTEKIDINGASQNITKAVSLVMPAEGVEMANKREIINVNISIEKIAERRISTSNIEIRNIPEGLSVEEFDKNISVLIRGVQSDISAAPENMNFYIDLKDASEGQNMIALQCEKPSELEVVSIEPGQLSVTLKKNQ